MGAIKGQREYERFKQGERLTRTQAVKAQCFSCNGEEKSAVDCQGFSCPLYQFQPYRGKKSLKVPSQAIETKEAEK